MNIPRIVFAACCATALGLPAFAEDLTIVYKTTAPNVGTATSYYTAAKMRVSDGQTDTIMEFGPGRLVSVDHKRKEYSEITLAEMEAALARMQQQAQMPAGMPPEMLKKMEQMMGGGAVNVVKGGVRKVAGYDCQENTVTMGSSTKIELCTSTAVAPPAPNVDYRKFASLAMAASPMAKSLGKLMDEMKKIQGFSLAESTSMKVMGMGFQSSREATKIERGAIPASTFDLATVAPGYKKVAHPITKMK